MGNLSEEKSQQEKDGLQSFASQALRLGKQGSYENLLCQHLIMSVNADTLHKVRLVCEGAFMAIQDKKFEIDLDLLNRIYSVCLTFQASNEEEEGIYVSWPFPKTETNYDLYIRPWYDEKVSLCFTSSSFYADDEKRKLLNKATSVSENFFLFTTELALHSVSLKMLKARFLIWAIPQIMTIFEKLSRLVQPDLYREILQTMKGEIDK
jgi:hypothetical protein